MRRVPVFMTGGLALAVLFSCANPAPAPWEVDREVAMERRMEAATVGPHHAHLARLAGKFDAVMRVWNRPDTEPRESTGTMHNRLILDGRFLLSEYHSETERGVFEGTGLMGYDGTTGRYQGTWADTGSTALLPLSTGACSDDGTILTMVRHVDDAVTGSRVVVRDVTTVIDDDHHRFEIFRHYPDHPEFRTLEVIYTRVR